MAANNREKIGQPLDGREAWKVGDVYSTGNPFKFVNPDVPDYSVCKNSSRWVISLNGRTVRGRLNGMRIFASAVAAASAAEQHYAERVATVREINEAQRDSESRYYPSHDRGTA